MSNPQDSINSLAYILTQHIGLNRLPPPEPGVFILVVIHLSFNLGKILRSPYRSKSDHCSRKTALSMQICHWRSKGLHQQLFYRDLRRILSRRKGASRGAFLDLFKIADAYRKKFEDWRKN